MSVAQSLKRQWCRNFPIARAPFAGTVVQVLKKEGEYSDSTNAAVGNALARIDDLSELYIETSAPEVEIPKLKIGQEALIRATQFLAEPTKVKSSRSPKPRLNKRTWDRSRVEFPLSIHVVDRDAELKPGMSVIVDIITLKLTNILTLPHEFIQKKGTTYFVKSTTGEKKDIEVGAQNEEVFTRSGRV